MSQTPSKDLFELIKSLNRAEKRYFKIFAGRHSLGGKNLYLKLFEAISHQSEYDEPSLKKKFKEELGKGSFAVLKNYLYNQLLRSLRAYNAEHSIEFKLRSQLNDLDILFGKGLINQCRKLLNKIRITAEKYEIVFLYPELLKWQRKLVRKESRVVAEDIMEKLEEAELTCVELVKNEFWALRNYDKVFNQASRYQQSNSLPALPLEIKPVSINPQAFVEDPGRPMSFHAKRALYLTLAHYYIHQKEPGKALGFQRHILDLWEGNPHQITELPDKYQLNQASYWQLCLMAQKPLDELPDLKETLAKPGLPFEAKARLLRLTVTSLMNFLLNHGRFEEALQIAQFGEQYYAEYEKGMQPADRTVFEYNTAILYFILEDFRKSLKLINPILARKGPQKHVVLQGAAWMLFMAIHFELDNIELVTWYASSQVKRFLDKHNTQSDFLSTTLSFFNQVEKKLLSGSKRLMFRGFWEELQEVERNHPNPGNGFEEIKLWAQSKAEGKKLKVVLTENIRSARAAKASA